MSGEANFSRLIKSMKPVLNEGEYVFCSFSDASQVDLKEVICIFREKEGFSVIFPKTLADEKKYPYTFVSSWITLTIHSSLEAVGLTAAVSRALAENNLSCNVVAGYHHDHVFVARRDTERAMRILMDVGRK
ncbi:MAG TPA: ACT domain-containing protein [Bacteroidales bacterium]|nr:ACT domain-containing protein [Bacteroidales bacterium]